MITSRTIASERPARERAEESAAGRSLEQRMKLAITPNARLWVTLVYVSIGIGCVLRVLRWLDDPALWLDEALLSINLLDKSFGELLGSLHFLQTAPPGFLLIEKSAETVLGDAEWSLRLFPLLASLASMFLFGYAARRVLALPAAALAVALFAVSEPLLERVAEVKPYSVDVAVATLLIALTLWVLEVPRHKMLRRVAVLGIAGLCVVWLSFPAAFSLAAAVIALGVYALETGSRRLILGTVVVGTLALAMFAAVYAVASSNLGRTSAAIFAGGSDQSPVRRVEIAQDAWSTFVNPGGFENGTHALAALLACFGALAFARRGYLHLLALFTTPALLALVAAALDLYPLGGRFSLYLVPFLLILVARGAQALVSWSRRPAVVSIGLGLFLVLPSVSLAAHRAFDPPAREDMKPLLAHLLREWRNGDALYVYGNAQYALRYYSTCEKCSPSAMDFPWPTRVAPPSEPGDQFAPALESIPPTLVVGSRVRDGANNDLARLQQPGRVWLLFTHVVSHGRLDDAQALLSELEREGPSLESVRARGARLYLFDRPAPSD